MVNRQCPGGFNYKRYKRNAALNAAFFFCVIIELERSVVSFAMNVFQPLIYLKAHYVLAPMRVTHVAG